MHGTGFLAFFAVANKFSPSFFRQILSVPASIIRGLSGCG
jgi:hypothetical protein